MEGNTSPRPSTDLTDGRYFGYIKRIDTGASPATLVYDVAQWFSGPDADRAAIEDGVIQPGEHIENDNYVRNVNPRLRTLAVSPSVRVEAIPAICCDNAPESFEQFVRTFRSGSSGMGSASSPWWLTIGSGRIVRIEEQYQP